MSRLLSMFSLLLILSCKQLPQGPAKPLVDEHSRIMNKIENDVTMPSGAGRVRDYERLYAWHFESGSSHAISVIATYQLGAKNERHWINELDMPVILDGGCSLVSLTFDRETEKIISISCHGEA